MGLKPDQMAAMEEMEADNMDQNLGMENQDLSRGNIFFYVFDILKILEVGLGVNEDLGNDQEMDDEVDIAMNNEGD